MRMWEYTVCYIVTRSVGFSSSKRKGRSKKEAVVCLVVETSGWYLSVSGSPAVLYTHTGCFSHNHEIRDSDPNRAFIFAFHFPPRTTASGTLVFNLIAILGYCTMAITTLPALSV